MVGNAGAVSRWAMNERAARLEQATAVEPYRPRPPFLGWPRQWTFSGSLAWLTPHSPAICVQTTASVATPQMANEVHDLFAWLAEAEVHRHFPGFAIFHDWRSIERVASGTRAAWMARMNDYGEVYLGVDFYLALSAHPVVRMALSTAALAVQLATGQQKTNVLAQPDAALAARGVRAPAPGFLELFMQKHGLPAFQSGPRTAA